MKHVLFYATTILLTSSLLFCQNNATPGSASEALPAERPDSLFGIKGSYRAGFKPISKTERDIVYQDFTVNVKDKEDGKGQDIKILRADSTGTVVDTWNIIHEEPTYFLGSARGQVFMEEGTGPENRKIVIYHAQRRALMFRWPFCGEMEVTANGNLRFYTPVEESEVTKMPECPDKEKWEKEGKKVVYGQLCLFSLVQRSLTKKSEYICMPL